MYAAFDEIEGVVHDRAAPVKGSRLRRIKRAISRLREHRHPGSCNIASFFSSSERLHRMTSQIDLDYQTAWTTVQMGRARHSKGDRTPLSASRRRPVNVRQEHNRPSVITAVTNTVPPSAELLSAKDDFIYISSDDSSDAVSDVDEAGHDGLSGRTTQNCTPIVEGTESSRRLLLEADDTSMCFLKSSTIKLTKKSQDRHLYTDVISEHCKGNRRFASLPLSGHKRKRSSRAFSCEPAMLKQTGSPHVVRATRSPTPAASSRRDSVPSATDFWDDCEIQTRCTSPSDDDATNTVEGRLSAERPFSGDKSNYSSAPVSTPESSIICEDTGALARSRRWSQGLNESSPDYYPRRSNIEIPIAAVDDADYYPSSTDVEVDEDSDHFSDEEVPLRKRRKAGKPQVNTGGASVRSEAEDLNTERDTTPPAALDKEPATAKATGASFDEFLLQDVVLMRTVLEGRATFQLQFDLDVCLKHWGKASKNQNKSSRGFVNATSGSVRRKFTSDEDQYIAKLKERLQLPWSDIHQRFCEKFVDRSKEALQVRYCTKLKRRNDHH